MESSALIGKVLALTGEIEQAAALADWPEAARLAEIRSPLIMSLDAQQVQGDPFDRRARRGPLRQCANHASGIAGRIHGAMRRASAVDKYQKTALL